ncbi:MAG: hypothetical protein JWN17_2998, partial [Frankiales bacterium]|nr:hypothetical protein [Frankiales bacterium]
MHRSPLPRALPGSGTLCALQAEAPPLLRRRPDLELVHLALDGLGEVEALVGLAGVEQLRDAVLHRAAAAAGTEALVAGSGDAVLVLADPRATDRVRFAVGAVVLLTDLDGGPVAVAPVVRAGAATGGPLAELLAAASAA